ncbi:hypothetical protein [Chromobacterium violaceum]|uniref:hypothetical protein n=1 Tax=Chromobacterium violaceum TaxID=536 RepID=UPI001B338FAB|nr:hypothetical protein [Chromobacterium violaceum]MBP4047186.1 hypothetical protein [Chromobacterium violaceum]
MKTKKPPWYPKAAFLFGAFDRATAQKQRRQAIETYLILRSVAPIQHRRDGQAARRQSH